MTFVRNRQTGKGAASSVEWRAAVYLRLSKEDGDKPESDSIQNQRAIIENHIHFLLSQGDTVVSWTIYSDDGYSGGNFDRPGYRRMISDIEAGKINCVIFKDNSRLGRNYPEIGKLMEEYFPQMNVRVISVLNHIDSFKDPFSYSSAVVSFSNIMNDDYIRQLSVKIKSTFAMKRARGEFLGNYAPYGYQKSPEDHHKLVIDPEAAKIVRFIYDRYEQGTSASGIVKELNALHIIPPSVYKVSKGCKGFAHHASGGPKKGVWSITTVNTILKDEVYIGNMVQGKFKSASYRTKKMIEADEDEWTVVEGTHEPIISDEQFTIVHDRFARRTRVASGQRATYLLTGFIRCAHCGARMNRQVSQGYARYRCMTRTYAPERCQCPSVSERLLESAILEAMQTEIQELIDAKNVIDAARKTNANNRASNQYLNAIKEAQREIERIKNAKFRMYDDYQNGIISSAEYADYRARYDAELSRLNESIVELEERVKQLQDAQKVDDDFVDYFRKHGNVETLNRDLLNQLLDHVAVTDKEHIDIYFKFSADRERILECAKAVRQVVEDTVC